MHRRKYLAATGSAVAAGLTGCFGIGGGGGGPDTPQGEVGLTIAVTADAFDPKSGSIGVGEAVEWVNEREGQRAQVRSDPIVDGTKSWEWRTEIQPGETATYTFQEPGVYAFKEAVMTRYQTCGAVAVGDASLEGLQLPCGSV